MFHELAPVLRHRAVLMTISFIEDDQIRVNIVPKKLKDDENKALTTPLTVTGTAQELDAELGRTLVDFVGSHLQLKNTLAQAKADMDTAAKAASSEAHAKTKTPVKKETNGATIAKPSEHSNPAKLFRVIHTCSADAQRDIALGFERGAYLLAMCSAHYAHRFINLLETLPPMTSFGSSDMTVENIGRN